MICLSCCLLSPRHHQLLLSQTLNLQDKLCTSFKGLFCWCLLMKTLMKTLMFCRFSCLHCSYQQQLICRWLRCQSHTRADELRELWRHFFKSWNEPTSAHIHPQPGPKLTILVFAAFAAAVTAAITCTSFSIPGFRCHRASPVAPACPTKFGSLSPMPYLVIFTRFCVAAIVLVPSLSRHVYLR